MWRYTNIPGWQCDKCGDVLIINAKQDGNYCSTCGAYHGKEIATMKFKIRLCTHKIPQTYKEIYVETNDKSKLYEYGDDEYFVSGINVVDNWVEYREKCNKKIILSEVEIWEK